MRQVWQAVCTFIDSGQVILFRQENSCCRSDLSSQRRSRLCACFLENQSEGENENWRYSTRCSTSLSRQLHMAPSPSARQRGGARRGSPGQWPANLVPIVAFEKKVWMVGLGKASTLVWFSNDGTRWVQFESDARWGERYGPTQAFFRNRLWILGGSQVTNSDLRDDIWYSEDGRHWVLATPSASWSPRRWHTTVAFKGKLWILGGTDDWGADGTNPNLLNDVWSSEDGIHWTKVIEHAPWTARAGHVSVVHDEKIWVVGGTNQNDVWYSSDGRRWKKATSNAGWPTRMGFGGAVFDGRLWVLGGMNKNGWLNDVWTSTNGVHWNLQARQAPWSPRSAEFSVVFNDRLWIYGGKGGAADVWYLEKGR